MPRLLALQHHTLIASIKTRLKDEVVFTSVRASTRSLGEASRHTSLSRLVIVLCFYLKDFAFSNELASWV